jgi:ankyrin repeat protein
VWATLHAWKLFQQFHPALIIPLLLLSPSIIAATNDPSALLQKALFEEEANHDLPAAIKAYQKLVSDLDENRKLAATAIFRLGECYRKQGRTNEAAAQYERVTRDFSDQSTLVDLSRQNLAGLGQTPTASTTQPLSIAARKEQKRLLEEEIKLVETKVADEQTRAKVGQPNDLLAAQRELLGLKRQVAALDVEATAPKEQAETTQAGSTFFEVSEAQEIKRIQAMIKDSPDLINGADRSQSPLYEAAQKGQLKVAEFLLANGAAVSKDGGNGTPLHAAAGSGHKEMIDLLLNHGANVNAGAPGRDTPLHLAAHEGLKTICEVLIAHKADVDARANHNYTPLHYAAQKGFRSIVELLLAHGADVNASDSDQATALFFAIQKRQVEIAKVLLSNKADPNLARSGGMTPLHLAAQEGPLAIVQLLLTNHANVNVKDNSGDTPLHVVASSGQPGVIEALLAYKADINAKNREGATPLIRAMAQKQWSAAKLLITSKADLNFSCSPAISNVRQSDFFPIHVAMYVGSDELLELLLKNGADPNAHTNQTTAPLHWTINSGRTDWADLLLKYKADPNLRSHGFPLLIIAINQRRVEIVRALLEHGADPNEPDPDGRTPLIVAVAFNPSTTPKEIVEALLEHKADVNVRWSGTGDTALHITVANGRRDIVDLLLAHGADPNLTNNEGKTPLALTKAAPPVLVSSGGVNTFAIPPGLPGTTTIPNRALRVPGAANPGAEEIAAAPNGIRDLLLKHGAVENLPDFSSIRIKGKAWPTEAATVVFKGPTNALNRFSLLEVIGNYYMVGLNPLASASPSFADRLNAIVARTGSPGAPSLPFPDFASIKIHRPKAGNAGEKEAIAVNLLLDANGLDCTKDVWLQFGDIIEISEREHTLAEPPTVFGPGQDQDLLKCLQRKVTFSVKGQRTEIILNGFTDTTYLSSALRLENVRKILRSSSDLSRVEVKRIEPDSRKSINLSVVLKPGPDDLWLRDGDVIEVPDKAGASNSGSGSKTTPGRNLQVPTSGPNAAVLTPEEQRILLEAQRIRTDTSAPALPPRAPPQQ